ncbi:MAG: BON domain-containing protein [Bryobacter sp.]|nr:BON domain-containing protein [Bryobacter sp.]
MTRKLFVLNFAGALLYGQKKITDGTIYDQVKLRLANDPDVKGGGLDVEVKEGAVTVKGRVTTEKAKAKIEKLVRRVKGVKQVSNQVSVEPS